MGKINEIIQESRESLIDVNELENTMVRDGMTYREIASFYLSVMSTQAECYQKLEEESRMLKDKKTPSSEILSREQSVQEQKTNEAVTQKAISSISNLNVVKYSTQFSLAMKCHRQPESFLPFLPLASTKDAEKILIHLQGIPYREILEQKRDYVEMAKTFPGDPILDEIEEQITYYESLVDFLKEYRENLFMENTILKEQAKEDIHERKIIFLRHGDDTSFEEDLRKIPNEFYGQIYKGLAGFRLGYKPIEKTLNRGLSQEIKQIKEQKIRIYATDLGDTFVILGVIVKKCWNDSLYRNVQENKMKLFQQHRDSLIVKKESLEFLQKERQSCISIEKVLSEGQKGKKVKQYGRNI